MHRCVLFAYNDYFRNIFQQCQDREVAFVCDENITINELNQLLTLIYRGSVYADPECTIFEREPREILIAVDAVDCKEIRESEGRADERGGDGGREEPASSSKKKKDAVVSNVGPTKRESSADGGGESKRNCLSEKRTAPHSHKDVQDFYAFDVNQLADDLAPVKVSSLCG